MTESVPINQVAKREAAEGEVQEKVNDERIVIRTPVGKEVSTDDEGYWRISDLVQTNIPFSDDIKIRPLTLGAMAELEREFGSLDVLENIGSVSDMLRFFTVLVKRDYPEMTDRMIGDLIPMDVDAIERLAKILTKVMEPAGKSQGGNPKTNAR